MKYKTTIELTLDAADKNEAAEIAGDYLSGNLSSGVNMKCRTRPMQSYNKYVVSVCAVLLIVTVSAIPIFYPKHSKEITPSMAGIDACQAPLKTSSVDKKDADFKKAWRDRQAKATLDFIKR